MKKIVTKFTGTTYKQDLRFKENKDGEMLLKNEELKQEEMPRNKEEVLTPHERIIKVLTELKIPFDKETIEEIERE